MVDKRAYPLLALIRRWVRPAIVISVCGITASGAIRVWQNAAESIVKSNERIAVAASNTLTKTLGDLSLLARLSTIENSLRYRSTEPVERVLNQAVVGESHILAFAILDAHGELFAANSIAPSGPYVGSPNILTEIALDKITFSRAESEKYGLVQSAVPLYSQLLLLRKPIYYDDEPVGSITGVISIATLFESLQTRAQHPVGTFWIKDEHYNASNCESSVKFLDGIYVCTKSSFRQVATEARSGLLLLLAIATLLGGIFSLTGERLEKNFFEPLDAIFSIIERIAQGDYRAGETSRLPDNLQRFRERLDHLANAAEEALHLKTTLAVNEARLELADQVAHDIKSPLTVLGMMESEIDQLPIESRMLFRSVIERINDIANQLLQRSHGEKNSFREIENAERKNLCSEPLFDLVELLVSEKKAEYRNRAGVSIELNSRSNSPVICAKVDAIVLKRVLSNLINNAVESIQNTGVVAVSVFECGGLATISVHDDGVGIPDSVLSQLGNRGATYGKPGGSGLGLFHARKAIESWQGKIEIKSTAGEGTEVSLTLPVTSPPSWAVEKLAICNETQIFILDDDPSVHQAWKVRLSSVGLIAHHLSGSKDTLEALQVKASGLPRLFLFDYQLAGEDITGIQLASRFNVGVETILVTNRAGEHHVRKQCQEIGARLLPKDRLRSIPVEISQRTPQS